jgi:flavin reductase (DIM6/NTAB) family NADH-FMN oxidoreductase RutF
MKAEQTFDPRAVRSVLGRFATGVCVMTASDPTANDGSIIGMTANSFTSVSLEPPLILWCLGHSARRYDIFAGTKSFGVNILGGHQADLSHRFARGKAVVDAEEGLTGAHPLMLKDVSAFLDCETYEQHTMGDHLVIVGRVLHFEQAPPVETSLTYHSGQYGRLGII